MPALFTDFLLMLRDHTVLWAIAVIASMAITAVVLYFFWDLVGRAISLVSRALNLGGAGRRG